MTLRRYLLVRTGWAAGPSCSPSSRSPTWASGWPATSVISPATPGSCGARCVGSRGHGCDAAAVRARERAARSSGTRAPVTLSLLLVTAVLHPRLVARPASRCFARRGRAADGGRCAPRVSRRVAAAGLDGALIGCSSRRQGPTCSTSPVTARSSRPPAGQCHGPVEWLAHLVWPAVALTVFYAAIYSRLAAARPRAGGARAPRQSRSRRGGEHRPPRCPPLLRLRLRQAGRSRPGVRPRLRVLRRGDLRPAGVSARRSSRPTSTRTAP